MERYRLIRQIDVYDNATDSLIEEIVLPELSIEKLRQVFGTNPEDPDFVFMYYLDKDKAKYFSEINFDFNKNAYAVGCFRGKSGTETEVTVINQYFKPEKAERYRNFVSVPKNRKKFIKTLAHLKDLDFSKFENIGKNIELTLSQRAKFAKTATCYAISENARIDAHFMEVEEAILKTVGMGMGTILVFDEDKLIYYEGEDINDRWISKPV
jgi:hypothetical protein